MSIHKSEHTMKKARTELATKSLPDDQIMTWECASWHAYAEQEDS